MASGDGRRPGPEDGRLVPEDEPEYESRALDRLIFFTDAVVAIAITLLAIDLPVPEGSTVALFWKSVRDNAGHYAAFLISFAVVAGGWANHHDLFRYARRTDPQLGRINTAWLLTIVLNPFATRMLTTSGPETLGAEALRFGFYALLQVLQAGTLLAMLRHMLSRGLMPGLPRRAEDGMARASYVIMLGFGLSIPLFFVTKYAWVLWMVFPLLAAVIRQFLGRNRGAEPG